MILQPAGRFIGTPSGGTQPCADHTSQNKAIGERSPKRNLVGDFDSPNVQPACRPAESIRGDHCRSIMNRRIDDLSCDLESVAD